LKDETISDTDKQSFNTNWLTCTQVVMKCRKSRIITGHNQNYY